MIPEPLSPLSLGGPSEVGKRSSQSLIEPTLLEGCQRHRALSGCRSIIEGECKLTGGSGKGRLDSETKTVAKVRHGRK